MANKKFSEFDLKTDSANVDFVVGYDGTDNVRIAPSNLSSGGASDLNGLSDVVINNTDENSYFINIPSSRSGDLGNLAIGKNSLNALTSGDYNTAIGASALNNLTTSEGATAIGYNAGAASGTNLMAGTTLIGRNAGFGRSGFRNVAIGDSPMGFGSGKTGVNKNTAIGYHALYRIDTNGVDNIAIGHEASQFLTTAEANVAIGDNAARSSTADYHISVGYQAGYSQTSGVENTNLGYLAGYSNTTSTGRTCIGYQAGQLSTGRWGTFIGQNSGRLNTGEGNTAVGRSSLLNATSGDSNVAVGFAAGNFTTTGSNNTFIGRSAGKQNTEGGNNTTLGYQAGDIITTGSNLTVIGYDADASSATATNEITLGNASVATLRCQVQTISALSDSRDKTNVQPSTYGLDFINKLNPVTFDWDMRDGAKVGDKDLGFIAQELQKVDDENLKLVYANNPDRLEASYGRLIPVLVQAIKELKAEIELLKS